MALEHEELTGRIIGAAIEVHRVLGPGFLESVHQRSLELELRAQGIPLVPQHEVHVRYRDMEVGRHLLDLYVNELIVVELKAVKTFEDAHFSIVRSYLRAVGREHGLLPNFARTTLQMNRVIAPSRGAVG